VLEKKLMVIKSAVEKPGTLQEGAGEVRKKWSQRILKHDWFSPRAPRCVLPRSCWEKRLNLAPEREAAGVKKRGTCRRNE